MNDREKLQVTTFQAAVPKPVSLRHVVNVLCVFRATSLEGHTPTTLTGRNYFLFAWFRVRCSAYLSSSHIAQAQSRCVMVFLISQTRHSPRFVCFVGRGTCFHQRFFFTYNLPPTQFYVKIIKL